MACQVYNVPVVLPALRREESYRQLVDGLEYLEAVAADIFSRLSCRVVENRDQLAAINQRVNVAQAKIDKLRNSSSKATRVFSPPKYPAPERLAGSSTVYQQVNPLLQGVRKTRVEFESRLDEVTADVVKAKRNPFLFDPKVKKRIPDLRFSSDDPEQGEGLGSLPRHLPSVSSLLLFNTSENPYKKYVVLDPLSGAKTKTRDKLREEEDKLSEAPVTITQGEELERGPQDSVMYVPIMPELPELEVPDLLPSLPFVAADMFYTADIGQGIAPSLATVVPELPDLADPSAPAAAAQLEPSSEVGGGAPPPPPPAPAPPLPPPPAPTQVVAGEESDDEEEDREGTGQAPNGVSDANDDRANLMEAIRNAGRDTSLLLPFHFLPAYPPLSLLSSVLLCS